MAKQVQQVEEEMAQGAFAGCPLDEHLVLELHRRICVDLVPQWAGRWRSTQVCVGAHTPPPPHQVPLLMREYGLDLAFRIQSLPPEPDEVWMECLAYAEGRLLFIHPFHDFNGRTTRVFLHELLRRMGLPDDVSVTPDPGEPTREYLAALAAADGMDWRPLVQVWKKRFEA